MLWNASVPQRAAAVARCRSAAEVSAAVQRARADGLPLSVLGGGHDWTGRAVRPGAVVIDLRGMRSVTVHGDVAVVGGGATAADLIAAAAEHGRSAATGTVGAVGMAGLTLGGGYGPLCGVAGLALDNLLGAEVVLADGSIVTTDENRQPDLFWALRGGGGNFGVVTSMRLRLHPIPRVHAGFVLFPLAAATDVLDGFADLAASAPDEFTAQTGVVSSPDATPMLFVNPTWSGPLGDGEHWVDRIAKLGAPVMVDAGPVDYAEPLRRGDRKFAADGRHYAIRTRTLAGLTPDASRAILTAGADRTSPLSAVSVHHFHGAATRVPQAATAFGLRQEHFMVEILAAWHPETGDDGAHRRWADETADLLGPYALPGGYPNLLDDTHHDQIAHAYGSNAERLLKAKAQFDPDGTFSAIPLPAPPEPWPGSRS
ncbi:FAD-binding oxidoreductase [Streptomyces sp. NPDC016845]|uniref:FAD-binding oxidoreductase n=1 Tax=Streptomyces sp. NPDC016845 TaxID=3364972 RepID=UPI0037BC4E99